MFTLKTRAFKLEGVLKGFSPGSEKFIIELADGSSLEVPGIPPSVIKTMSVVGLHKLKDATVDLSIASPVISMGEPDSSSKPTIDKNTIKVVPKL